MDANEIRKAAFAQARAESLDTLARVADVRVEPRFHDGDDAMTQWRTGMPEKPPTLTTADVEQKIHDYHKGNEMRPVTAEVITGLADTLLERVGTEARAIAKQRRELLKRIDDDRRMARSELNRLRADYDKRISTQAARMIELQTTVAGLELRLDAFKHEVAKRAIEGNNVIELPNPLGPRRA